MGRPALSLESSGWFGYDRDLRSDEWEIPGDGNADQDDFDNDRLGDACDPDIDHGDLPIERDACDFTPLGAVVNAEGTLGGDLDGDCDVDLDDYQSLSQNLTGPNRQTKTQGDQTCLEVGLYCFIASETFRVIE